MKRDLDALTKREFDLAVIGGGIVGACLARDAARRGLAVALVEAEDFACAASEAMSHFIHGGIRYLAQGQFATVRLSLRERETWRRIAPDLVTPQPFLMPLSRSRRWSSRASLRTGVAVFEAMGTRGFGRRLTREEAIGAEPALDPDETTGALLYADYRIDEPERAVLAVLQDAVGAGASIANHVEARGLGVREGVLTTLAVGDRITGEAFVIRARAVANATGPWAQTLASLLAPGQTGVRLTLSKGIHLVTKPVALRHALAFSANRRHAFVTPWKGMNIIGTTDEAFNGDPAKAAPTPDEIAALAEKVGEYLPAARDKMNEPLDTFGAVRAIPGVAKSTYRAPRESLLVHHDDDGAPGFFTLCGGKWTTARHMGEEATDAIVRYLGKPCRPCDTASSLLPRPGSGVETDAASKRGEIEAVRFALAADREMAVTPADFARRLGRAHAIANPGVAKRAGGWLASRAKGGQVVT